jgi:hypothetical protein
MLSIGPESLIAVNADRMPKTTMVKTFIGLLCTNVFDRFFCRFFK